MEVDFTAKQNESKVNGLWPWLIEPGVSIADRSFLYRSGLFVRLLFVLLGWFFFLYLVSFIFYSQISTSLFVVSGSLFTTFILLMTWISHRNQIEINRQAQLHEHQEHSWTLAEAVAAAIVIYQDSRICYVNAATESLTGCVREQLLGLPIWEIIHPDFRSLIQAPQVHPTRYELKFLTKDKQARWVDYTTNVIKIKGQPAILGTAFDITERKEAKEALQVSLELIERAKQEWEGTADSLPQLVYLLNNERCVLRANRTIERWGLGEVVKIKDVEAHQVLHPNCVDPECYLANFWDYAWQELQLGRSVEHEAHDPILKRHLYIQVRPMSTQTDKRYKAATSFAVAVIHDITTRKRAEEKLQNSLTEKVVMLKEIHHRVKNNLQIISSLLYLQSRAIQDPTSLEVFRESQTRVKSMALIHDKLYQSNDLSRINFAEYIHSLAEYLSQSYQMLQDVRFKIDTDEVFLTIDTAIPCGLIINELVSNALKYAFKPHEKGQIRIELRILASPNEELLLIIADDGVGMPEHINFRKTGSLGLQLVNNLVKQLSGTIVMNAKDGGTSFKITFSEPKEKHES